MYIEDYIPEAIEIKRELVIGELSDPKKVVLPIAAALGGVIVPMAIYLALQTGQPAVSSAPRPCSTRRRRPTRQSVRPCSRHLWKAPGACCFRSAVPRT